jgi:hypothetical protein
MTTHPQADPAAHRHLPRPVNILPIHTLGAPRVRLPDGLDEQARVRALVKAVPLVITGSDILGQLASHVMQMGPGLGRIDHQEIVLAKALAGHRIRIACIAKRDHVCPAVVGFTLDVHQRVERHDRFGLCAGVRLGP